MCSHADAEPGPPLYANTIGRVRASCPCRTYAVKPNSAIGSSFSFFIISVPVVAS